MTIVDKLRKLITTKGGDPTGVMTIAEGVDRLEKTEEGGGGGSGGPEAVYLYMAPYIAYDYNTGALGINDDRIYTNPDRTEYIHEAEVLYDLGIIGSSLTPKALYLVDVGNEDLISLYPATVHMTRDISGIPGMAQEYPAFSTMPIHRIFDNPDMPGGYEATYQLHCNVYVDAETGASELRLSIYEP